MLARTRLKPFHPTLETKKPTALLPARTRMLFYSDSKVKKMSTQEKEDPEVEEVAEAEAKELVAPEVDNHQEVDQLVAEVADNNSYLSTKKPSQLYE